MLDAALETLRSEGFAGTSARAIAQRGGLNQALIFYHYGGVNQLLLAALAASSEQRLARYRAAVDRAGSLAELSDEARRLYEEDVVGGHVTVVSEMIGASLSHPELREEVLARMQPWLALAEETVERFGGGLVPTAEAAFGVVALALGVNLLSHLDPADERVDRLFELVRALAP